MVKVGFIVEGHSEVVIVRSDSFKVYLNSLGLETSYELTINAVGKNNIYDTSGNLNRLKTDTDERLNQLYELGAVVVFILLDRDNADNCLAEFKSKIYRHPETVVIVAMQQIEAWFLADTDCLRQFMQKNIPEIESPESFLDPIGEIDRLRKMHSGIGIGGKIKLANTIVHRCNFSLANAAAHPSCPSGAYFQRKLIEVAQNR